MLFIWNFIMNILHSQQSQIPSESDVLTPEEINELNNMQRGDSSNKKGALYEKNFTIYQMLRYTQQVLKSGQKLQDQDNIIFSNCERAAVDDLCILSNGKRYNYQLKDSKTSGRWNQDLSRKFQIQTKLDNKLHQCNEFLHTLVCSCKDIVARNQIEMQRENETYQSMYYPNHPTPLGMLEDEETELRQLLGLICHDKRQYETALRCIGSVQGQSVDFKKSLNAWWNDVLESSKPNLFFVSKDDIPSDVIDFIRGKGFSVQSGSIGYDGLSITLSEDLITKLQQKSTIDEIFACTDAKELALLRYSSLA